MYRVQRLTKMLPHGELVEQDGRRRRVAGLSVEWRNAFHLSMTANRISLLFVGPSHA